MDTEFFLNGNSQEDIEYDPKFTKDEFAEKAKPIFSAIIDAYSKAHHISMEEEESTFDHEAFTSLMEDIMFNETDFLDLLEGRILN